MIEDIQAVVFYLDKQGPNLAYNPPTRRHSLFSESDYIKMSTFYYMAIGMGNSRNYGLFELPVPNHPEYHAIIYSFDVDDPENEDPRAEHKNYCLLVLLFPKLFRKFLMPNWKLEMAISEFLMPYYKLKQYKNKKLIDSLLGHIIPDIPTFDEYLEEASLIPEINTFSD